MYWRGDIATDVAESLCTKAADGWLEGPRLPGRHVKLYDFRLVACITGGLLPVGLKGRSVVNEEALTEVERRLVQAMRTRSFVDLREGDTRADDPAAGDAWGPSRTVSAEVLVDLLTEQAEHDGGRPATLGIRGARIAGRFDARAATLVCPLVLRECYVAEPMVLQDATARTIRLLDCHMVGMDAAQVRTDGNLELSGTRVAHGEVRLAGATVGGQLHLDGAQLANPSGRALTADGLTVERSMLCRGGFTARGEVRLTGARIGGDLELSGASLANPGARALTADGLVVGRDMDCRAWFSVRGEVRLSGARIGGQLHLTSASLANPDGLALVADGLVAEAGMFCRAGFTSRGEMRLAGATIGAQLHLTGAYLANPSGRALTADGLTVERSMLCTSGFRTCGEVRLSGGRVGGNLDLSGASLTNPEGRALTADRLAVGRSMFCRAGFTARGEVRLTGARIGAQLDFSTARLSAAGGTVAHLDRIHADELFLLPAVPPDGSVNLTGTRVGSFYDDPETWPGTFWLAGFVYETLGSDAVSVRVRLRWLTRNRNGYAPGPYDELAGAYRRAGYVEAARQVMIAKQWRRRVRTRNPLGQLWNLLLYATIGYGYRSWLAAIWLAVFFGLGVCVFDAAYPTHVVASASPPPTFHAAAYALDVLLPGVDLGQRTAWMPRGAALQLSWLLGGAGWVLTTVVVAGLTGVFQRE